MAGMPMRIYMQRTCVKYRGVMCSAPGSPYMHVRCGPVYMSYIWGPVLLYASAPRAPGIGHRSYEAPGTVRGGGGACAVLTTFPRNT